MSNAPEKLVAIVLAGGQGSRLHELTEDTCKPAVAFSGGHRIVDWTMDNLARAKPGKVLVATQYRPTVLVNHLYSHWRAGFAPGALTVRDGRKVTGRASGYAGTADAVTQNFGLIDTEAPDMVLVVAADHVYRMDYTAMLRAHVASGRPVTVGADRVPLAQASAFGVIETDAKGRAVSFIEKPQNGLAATGDSNCVLASMGIYVFDRAWLREALIDDATDTASSHDFGHDILPLAVSRGEVHVYDVAAAEPGFYWRDVGTLDSLRQTCIELDGVEARCPRPAYPGRPVTAQPTLLLPQETVALSGAMVSRGARLRKVIVAPGAIVPGDLVVGFDGDDDARHFRVTPQGTVLITSTMLAKRRAGAVSPARKVPFTAKLGPMRGRLT